ncbi:winged helix-turn-helix domain-containing protein, partial [Parafannyhessea umbonata]
MAGHIAAPLKQRVYQELKAKIERGELAQGEKIGELTVSEAMGVSRTPVREALIQLEADGYLE